VRLDDLPEGLREQVIQAVQKTKPELAVEEPRSSEPEDPSAAESERLQGVSEILEGMRQSFDADRIDYDEYREMVLQHLKRFLEDLDPKAALGFVLNDLRASELGRFVDDSIYKSLCGKLLAAAVPPVEKPRRRRFRIFGNKGKT
jgi:hypothetical protein